MTGTQKWVGAIAAALLVAYLISIRNSGPGGDMVRNPEDARVMAAAVDYVAAPRGDKAYVLDQRCFTTTDLNNMAGSLGTANQDEPEAHADVAKRNGDGGNIEAPPSKTECIVLTHNDVTSLFNEGGYEAVYKRYPKAKGILVMSFPGYSKDHKKALLYVGRKSSLSDGLGQGLLLQKTGGNWQVIKTYTVWAL